MKKAFSLRGNELDGRAINVDVAAVRNNAGGGNRQGGYGGGSGGYGGGSGGFGGGQRSFGNNNANRSTTVNLSRNDQAAKKGSIGEFKGKKIAL